MAKNIKKKKQPQPQKRALSPERFMKEKSRKLPLYKCYITKGWKEAGESNVFVARRRPNGNIAFGLFLVDTYCLGVKDAAYKADCSESEFKDLIETFDARLGMVEVDYEEAHNLIYGAIAFAEEGGVEPHPDFGIAGGILEEDTDDIPLIEFEFGKDGKHLLIVGADRREMLYFDILQRNLGDNFDYIMTDMGLPGRFEDWDNDLEEDNTGQEPEDD